MLRLSPVLGIFLTALLTLLALPTAEFVRTVYEQNGQLDGTGAFLLIRLVLPLLVTASALLLLAPGALLVFGMSRKPLSLADLAMRALFLSIFVTPFLAAAVTGATGITLTGTRFALFLVLLSLPGLWLLSRSSNQFAVPRAAVLVSAIGLPILLMALLAEKFHYEVVNGDGAHALLSAEMIMRRGIPFWPADAGFIGGYPSASTLTEVIMQSNFVRLFGTTEAAARFAYIPGVMVLVLLLVELIEQDGDEPLCAYGVAGLTTALLLVSFVLAYQTSYNPYFTDIALPMAREPKILVGALGFIWYFLNGPKHWMVLVALISLLSAPNAILIIGFFLAAYLVAIGGFPMRRVFVAGLLVLLGLIAANLFYAMIVTWGYTAPSAEFGPKAILRRLRFITLFDFQRFGFWMLPAGILPAVSLFFWRWQDRLTRVLTLTTLAYVGFFYVQAYRILPHHFTPAMVLPLIVYWRIARRHDRQIPAAAFGLTGCLIAAWISWPPSLEPHRQTREVASRIELPPIQPGSLNASHVVLSHELIDQIFPFYATDADNEEFYTMEAIALYYYARDRKPEGVNSVYVARRVGDGLENEVLVGQPVRGWAMYTNDPAQLAHDRLRGTIETTISPVYRVSRHVLFGSQNPDDPRIVWDLAALAGLR